MKIRVCKNHTEYKYTLENTCPTCKKPTDEAHYKYVNLAEEKDFTQESSEK